MSKTKDSFRREPICETLRKAAQARPDEHWIRFIDSERLTYGEAWSRAKRTGGGLRARGVKKGDRVALMMENSPEFLATWFGALQLGAIAVPVNTSAKGAILDHYLRLTSPSAVVLDPAFVPQVKQALETIGASARLVATDKDFAELLQAPPASADSLALQDPAVIMFTSGTTGPSKGILFSHHFLANFAHHAVKTFGFKSEDVIYSCLPYFHANALILMTCGALLVGAPVNVARRFSVSKFWAEINETQATVTSLLGAMATLLLQQPPTAAEKSHRVTRAMLVPAPAEYYELLDKRFGITPLDMYGQSDAGILISPMWGGPIRPGSCGKVMEGYEVRLVDDDGEEVPRGTAGEVVVRPTRPGMISDGYWAMPEKTVEAWRGLWHHTGDLLRQDEEGWFYFLDRKKDAIRRRGENVSSYEVEQAFIGHAGISDVAAYAIPSELTEDEVAIAVVAKPGVKLDALGLVRFVEDKLPYFYLPRYVTFLPELPMTPTHKVRKEALSKLGVTKDTWDMQASCYRPTRS